MAKPAASTDTPKDAPRKPKGEGTTITVDLHDNLDLLTRIRAAAKSDDREPSKWIRRRILQLDTDGKLF